MNEKNKRKQTSLWEELMRYEKQTPMTQEERLALHEWVREGNSVYENGSMGSDEKGNPLPFLDVYRYEEKIRSTLEGLDERGRENYLARLRGEDTLDNLREDMQEMQFRLNAYEMVLKKSGLFKDALDLMDYWKSQRVVVPETTEELPFN